MLTLNKFLETLKNLDKKIWLVSDTHFGHLKCYEEFEPKRKAYSPTFENFEQRIITNWNSCIGKDDIVIHLGDFCINKHNENVTIKNIKQFTQKLNGVKILFKGNHDKLDKSIYLNSGWDYVFDKPIIYDGKNNIVKSVTTDKDFCGSLVIEINDKKILFSHFNILFYEEQYERKYLLQFDLLRKIYNKTNCVLNIHGHAHSKVESSETNINVSIENIDFKPILLNDMF